MTKTITKRPSQQIQQAKKQQFVEMYQKLMGHIGNVCSAVGINRSTYYDWLNKDPQFMNQIMELEMDLNDDIREVLISKAAEGDLTAVIFYLKKRHPDFKEQRPQTLVQVNNMKAEEFFRDVIQVNELS